MHIWCENPVFAVKYIDLGEIEISRNKPKLWMDDHTSVTINVYWSLIYTARRV
jgi:hypothetical protein